MTRMFGLAALGLAPASAARGLNRRMRHAQIVFMRSLLVIDRHLTALSAAVERFNSRRAPAHRRADSPGPPIGSLGGNQELSLPGSGPSAGASFRRQP